MRRIDISIGPVQGFVSQSRRTRDLWGSSYLLAFLSAHAMAGAQQAGGKVVQPVVDGDRLYRWVTGQREGNAPRLGSLPNHFVVEVDGTAQAVAHESVRAFEDAWRQVCDPVWREYVEHACADGNDTARIWDRQVGTFWEVMWTAEPDEGECGLLARRKRWRNHRPPEEPGDKCTVMHDLQELSGYVRSEGSASRERQNQFWKTVRHPLGSLDLREDERLCAVALVKRLFPRVAPRALGWKVDRSHWPSTVYVGAVPWIRRVEQSVPELARRYAETVTQHAPKDVVAEKRPPFAGLGGAGSGRFSNLDANWFHRQFVTSEPLRDDAAPTARDELERSLKVICDAKDDAGRLGAPSSFYAMLLADGDRLGRLVGRLGGETVGRALAAFTDSVPSVVRNDDDGMDGVTVYAGGDDVLAMLPVPKALQCAASLAERYHSAFPDTGAEATLSAAVVFAHVRLPLRAVLDEAHRLLDAVAKDGNGRNSLAAGVLKPGGLHCQWTTTWTRTRPGDGDPVRAVELLDDLVGHLRRAATEPGLSSALIYRIRETLTLLCGVERWQPGHWGTLPDALDVRAFVHAEILHSLTVRIGDEDAAAGAEELTDAVWRLLGPSRADRDDRKLAEAGVDALLLARFLSDGGREEVGP